MDTAHLLGDVFIFINEKTFNVSGFYRMKGFSILPPQLTMTGAEIKTAIGADHAYLLRCDDPWNELDKNRGLSDSEGVPLIPGMRFNVFPPATSGGSLPGPIKYPEPLDWPEIHSRYQRRDYSVALWENTASVPAPVVDREAVMDALNSAGVDLYPQQKRKIADAILALIPAGTEGEK